MNRRSKIAATLLAAVALGAGALGISSTSASTPTTAPTWRTTVAGDTWQSIAVEIAPGASPTAQAAFARTLDQNNCNGTVAGSCDTNLLTAALQANWQIHYSLSDVPAATTTTTAAPTTTTIAPTTTTTPPPSAPHNDATLTSFRSVTGGADTSFAYTCPTGDIIVSRVLSDADSGSPVTVTMSNSGTALTWHTVGTRSTHSYAGMFWALCDGVSRTYTATSNRAKPEVMQLTTWSNVNTTTPFPTASVKTGQSTANPTTTTSYTSTVANSVLLGDAMDWNNQPGIATTAHVSTAVQVTAANDGIFADESTHPTPTVGTSVNINFSTTTGSPGPDFAYVVAELVPPASGGGTTTTTAATTTTLAATTTTAAATTTTAPPSGKFHTVSTSATIVDPLGASFKPKGVNCGIVQVTYYPPTSAYTQGGSCDSALAGHLENHATDALTYGFNMIRLNLNPGDSTVNLQKAIDDFTSVHIVVQLDCHQDLGGEPSFATWSASGCASILATLLDANKTNTYVWIEALNEPWQNATDVTGWSNFNTGVYNWVRTTHSAPDTMIATDMLNYGQAADLGGTYQTWLSGKTNNVLAWHQYGSLSFGSATDAQRTTAANLLLTDHVPTIVEEVGYNIDGVDRGTATADDTAGFNWMVANWSSYPFGGLFWHGTGAADARDLRQCSPAVPTAYDCAWYTTSLSPSAEGTAFFPLASSPV